MRFTPCPRDLTYTGNIQSWQSETGVYQLRFNRVIFGYRVQLMAQSDYSDEWGVVGDYCAGASVEWMEIIHLLMQKILLRVPESTHRHKLETIWPRHTARPMSQDMKCLAQLVDLAGGIKTLDFSDLAQVTVDLEAHLEVEHNMAVDVTLKLS
jgi:hypothetical protein